MTNRGVAGAIEQVPRRDIRRKTHEKSKCASAEVEETVLFNGSQQSSVRRPVRGHSGRVCSASLQ